MATLGKRASIAVADRRELYRRHREYRRLKRVRRNTVPPYRNCRNCGEELHGMYCSACGQYALEVKQNFGKMMGSFFENTFQLDGKIWQTLLALCIHPGLLTAEFMRGRIKSYVHPVKLYLFMSMLLFGFVLIVTENKDTDSNGINLITNPSDSTSHAAIATVFENVDTTSMSESDKAEMHELKQAIDQRLADKKQHSADLHSDTNGDDEPLKFGLLSPAEQKAVGREFIDWFLKYMPIFILVLSPVYALLLQGAYRKSAPHYIDNFIFSIHGHTFVILIVTVATIIDALTKLDCSTAVLLLTMVYILLASHNFYRQSWGKTIGKTLLTLLVYMFVVAVAAVLFVIVALLVINSHHDFDFI